MRSTAGTSETDDLLPGPVRVPVGGPRYGRVGAGDEWQW